MSRFAKAGRGRVAEMLASEVSVFRHAFGFWRRPLPEPAANHFYSRERSGYGLLVGGVAVASAVEIFPMHLLLSHFWTPVAGWVATALTIYGVVWLVGDWQAARRIPTVVDDETLRLRVGLRWRVDVPRDAVAGLRRVPASEVKVKGALQALAAGRPTHCLDLNRPVTAEGPYGLRREVERIALQVDEPERFEAALASGAGRRAQGTGHRVPGSPEAARRREA